MSRGRVLPIPSPSLVVLIGAAGSGKTTFARRNFLPAQIVSSDECRAAVAGDPADQAATPAAFDLAHRIVDARLRRGLLTVFDATSVERAARRPLLDLAARHHLPAVALVFDLPLEACVAQDRARSDRRVGRTVIARQARRLAADLPGLGEEGLVLVRRLGSPRSAAEARVEPVPLPCDRSAARGPFDLIGDLHGCDDELRRLLVRLGYERASARGAFRHPEGRRAVFLGDLVERGPGGSETARIVMRMVAEGSAFCVPGNHDDTLRRHFEGEAVKRSPGFRISMAQIEALPVDRRRRFAAEFRAFVGSLPPHLVLDGGRLVAAHAGLKPEHVGRHSHEVRRFALYGQTTGEVDRYGLPVRVKWAAAYHGRGLLVYGHTPVPEPEWIRNTVNIDTGCVYGGRLTALSYPELTLATVPAARAYYRSPRPIPTHVGLRAETRSLPTV